LHELFFSVEQYTSSFRRLQLLKRDLTISIFVDHLVEFVQCPPEHARAAHCIPFSCYDAGFAEHVFDTSKGRKTQERLLKSLGAAEKGDRDVGEAHPPQQF